MKIIWYLVWKHITQSAKKSTIAILSIVLSVTFFTVISNTFLWGFQYLKDNEVENYGSWQARYYGLNIEQVDKLKKQDEFESCIAQEENGSFYVDVELKKVDKSIFETTQEIGKKIGMSTLDQQGKMQYLPSSEPAEYDISYHMELLDFYGVAYENGSISIKYIMAGVLALAIGIFALLIYSIFSLSFMEKRKYIGLLDCVGASSLQRKMFVFGEGIILGSVSIPIGIVAGSIGTRYAIKGIIRFLKEKYSLDIIYSGKTDIRVLLLAAVLGGFTILMASIIPIVKAGKVSALELVAGSPMQQPRIQESDRNKHSFSVEFDMARKNLASDRQKSIKIIFLMVLAIVMIFNGYVYLNILNGKYLLQDRRPRKEPDTWVSIYSDDITRQESIEKEVSGLPSVTDSSYISILDIGAIAIDKKYIADDLDVFSVFGLGRKNPVQFADTPDAQEEKYAFSASILGMKDQTFKRYAQQNNISIQEDTDDSYPVIIESYMPIEEKHKEPLYRSPLKNMRSGELKFMFGANADFVLLDDKIYRGKTKEMSFDLLGVTENSPPIPMLPEEYASKIGSYSQLEDAKLRIYMPYSSFLDFLRDSRVEKTYGEFSGSDNPIMYRESNPVQNFILFDKSGQSAGNEMKKSLSDIMGKWNLAEYTNSSSSYINSSNSWEYSNVKKLIKQKMLDVSEITKKMFISGAIVLIGFFAVFSLFNYLFTSMYIRKREFAILKSVGMINKSIKKMILYEMAIFFTVSSILGAVIGYILAFLQMAEYKKTAATDIIFPHGFFLIEIVALFIIIFLVSFLAVGKIKDINLIVLLKNENE